MTGIALFMRLDDAMATMISIHAELRQSLESSQIRYDCTSLCLQCAFIVNAMLLSVWHET